MAEYVAHVPYAELVQRFRQAQTWTCIVCGSPVRYRGFGHAPRPRVPLFECTGCGRRSDGCQTFEGHRLLYGACALDDDCPVRCGHWLCSWERPRGTCPVCGRTRETPSGASQPGAADDAGPTVALPRACEPAR
jgi:hypothetical protein